MTIEADEAFRRATVRHRSQPDVTTRTGFGGSEGLRVGGKIFTMLVRDELVVKLPRDRAAAIVAVAGGTPFDPGHGRVMREWVSVSPARETDWPGLVREAFDYVGAQATRTGA